MTLLTYRRLSPRPSVSRHLAVVAALLLHGCGGSDRDAGGLARRQDSAGITIVDNGPLDRLPTFRLDSATVSIGRRDGSGPDAFVVVSGALRLPDGRLVISDPGSQSVRLFDSTGGFVRAVSRSGNGPGEMNDPSAPRRLGPDTFYVIDRNLQRAVFYDDSARMRTMTGVSLLIHRGADDVVTADVRGMISTDEVI